MQAPKEVMLDLAGVSIEHGYLIQSRVVGRWNVFHCLCCKMDTHGVPNRSILPFLANPTLLVSFSSFFQHVFFTCLSIFPV